MLKFNKPTTIADGTYLARIVHIIDMGLQGSLNITTNLEEFKRIIKITFEVLDEEETPTLLSKDYTAVMSSASHLYALCRALQPNNEKDYYNVAELINSGCIIAVENKTSKQNKTYTNVNSVTAPVGSMELPKARSNQIVYDIEEGERIDSLELPDWTVKKIKDSPSYGK